jgi:predicted ABC-type ATPase
LDTNLRPTLIVIAGPNGSGKTSLTTQVLQHRWIEGCTYINPDDLAHDVFGDWNSPDAVLKAAQLAGERREICLRRGGSMAFESVLSAPDKVEFIERAKAKGFFVRVFFVGTDHPSINAARIARRVMEGGHDVPIQKIIGRYAKSISNCAAVATFVDRVYVYDNSVEHEEPKLLFRASAGRIVKVHHAIHDWASPIANNLGKETP